MASSEPENIVKDGIPSRWLIILATTTITIACLLSYGNALNGDWALDDFNRIVENEDIRMETFSMSALWQAAHSPPGKRRWITNASFAVNYYLNGLSPRWFKFVNISLHAFTALGLFFFLVLLIRQLAPGDAAFPSIEEHDSEDGDTGADLKRVSICVAWVTALLWSVHPVLTQAVNYTTQRGVILSGLFYLWGLWGFLEWRSRERWGGFGYLLFTVLMFLLSVLSKETGATFVLAVGLLYWLDPAGEEETARRNWVIGVCLGGLFAIVSLYLLGGFDGAMEQLERILSTKPQGSRRFTTWQRVMTEWRVMVFYLSLVVFPGLNRLNLEHDIQVSTGLFSPPTTVLALVLIVALLAGAYKLRHRYPLVTFGLFWFFLQLIITSTVLNLELIFEHRVYLAVIGPMFIFVYVFLRNGFVPWQCSTVIVIFLVGVLSWTTYQRNAVWANTLTLYHDAAQKAPNKPRNWGNLGVAYAEEARRLLQSKQNKEAFHKMVNAIRFHRTALTKSRERKRPIASVFTENIDNILMELTDVWRKIEARRDEPEWTEKLVNWHEEILFSVHPKYVQNRDALKNQLPELHIYLAGVYNKKGETTKAEKELVKVIRRHPERTQEMLDNVEDPELKRSLRERVERLQGDK